MKQSPQRWRFILNCAAMAVVLAVAIPTATRLTSASTSTDEAVDALGAGDEAQAIVLLDKAVARGDTEAANLLGELVRLGSAPNQDPNHLPDHGRACDLFETAALAGLAAAQHNLATCYYTGTGRELDYRQSFAWYQRAADQGLARSYCALGNHFLYGQGVPQDGAVALDLCRRGARAGDSYAQADLGQLYLAGRGGAPDYDEAVKWLSLAASNGQRNAAFHLGRLHWAGEGVPRNPHAAAYWFRIAAERGRMDAFLLAGQTYFAMAMSPDGNSVNELYAPQALVWLALAAEFEPNPAKRAEAVRLHSVLATAAPHLKSKAEEQTAAWRARVTEASRRS